MSAPLTPARWRQVNDLFHAAIERSPEEREAWLADACGGDDHLRREVDSLLAADAVPDTDQHYARAVDAAVAEAAAVIGGPAGTRRLGPYRILREIGQGGMATVFLAMRDDDEFQQRVAIKVVRGVLGTESLLRFRAERQILASLEHPSIARLLDGGTTDDGVPYLVMEYIEGKPIDRFCDDGQLSVPDRLALVCRVCDAVNHAHHSLVVHRDLKPSNILVTADGTPKLLDFGIAKLLEADGAESAPVTLTGFRALTPEYASPEQLRGDPITTASDVYSLGVLLFELLTGEPPLVFATRQPAEIERVVCTVDPHKPSTVVASAPRARALMGDLDTITLTALSKESGQRYATAADLADELRRHLNGLPVLARPATWRYRSERFIRRHRVAVGVAAVFFLVVIGFVAALAVQVRRVARERDTAEQVTDLLIDLYSAYDPSRMRGNRVTPQDVLDRGAARIESELADQPEMQARMFDAIGLLYKNIGASSRAVDVLRSSLALRQGAGHANTLESASTEIGLAGALIESARFAEAEPIAREALETRRQLAGPRSSATAEALHTYGLLRFFRGGLDAGPLMAEAVEIWRATKGVDSDEFAVGLADLTRTWRERADYLKADRYERADLLKAERFNRVLLASRRAALGDHHQLVAMTINTIGQLQMAMGRSTEAEPMFREALAIRRQLAGGDRNTQVVESLHNLAQSLHEQRRLQDAQPLYRAAIDSMRLVLASGVADRSDATVRAHPQLAINLNNFGTLLEEEGRFDEAEKAFAEAIDMRRQLLGRDHPGVARTLHNLARALHHQGRHAEALAVIDDALAIQRKALGDDDFETVMAAVTRGEILIALDRRGEAEPLLRQSLTSLRGLLPADNVHIQTAAAVYARLAS